MKLVRVAERLFKVLDWSGPFDLHTETDHVYVMDRVLDATPAEGHSLGWVQYQDTIYYYLDPHQDMTPEDEARWADILARTS